jgi:hypothetical protein
MPGHFSFAFGFGSYFNFSFCVGQAAESAAPLTHVNPSIKASSDVIQGQRKELLPEQGDQKTKDSHTFIKLKDLQNIIDPDSLIPITRAKPQRSDGKKVIHLPQLISRLHYSFLYATAS